MLKAWAKFFLILILISLLVAVFSRHTLCRFLISRATTKATKLKLSIEELNLDILNHSLHLRGITLFNPPGFENEVLGKAKEIFIRYDLLDSLRGRLRLRQVKADISEINIIRNEGKESNLFFLRQEEAKKNPSGQNLSATFFQKGTEKARKQLRPKFIIDRLELRLEKVTFLNYDAGIGESAVIIFTVQGPCVFKNVNNLKDVADSVSAKGGFSNLLDRTLSLIPKEVLPKVN